MERGWCVLNSDDEQSFEILPESRVSLFSAGSPPEKKGREKGERVQFSTFCRAAGRTYSVSFQDCLALERCHVV